MLPKPSVTASLTCLLKSCWNRRAFTSEPRSPSAVPTAVIAASTSASADVAVVVLVRAPKVRLPTAAWVEIVSVPPEIVEMTFAAVDRRLQQGLAVVLGVVHERGELSLHGGKVGRQDRLLVSRVTGVHAFDRLLLHVGEKIGDLGRAGNGDVADALTVRERLVDGLVGLEVGADALRRWRSSKRRPSRR